MSASDANFLNVNASPSHGSRENLSGTPFFADVMMDLSEAHDLAETPDASRPRFNQEQISSENIMNNIKLPSLSNDSLVDEGNIPETPTVAAEAPRQMARISNFEEVTIESASKSVPRFPRDVPWAISFLIFVPISLIWPMITSSEPHSLAVHPLSTATMHSLLWAGVAAILVSRIMYRTAPGGDGDDARFVVGSLLTASVSVSIAVNFVLTLLILSWLPRARWGALLPAFAGIRDMILYIKWRPQRQAFEAVSSMVLDVLSRSLRRASFFRMLALILALQWFVLFLWRLALLHALGHSFLQTVVTLIGFKWATGWMTRLLSLVASAGTMSWFAGQASLVQNSNGDTSTFDEDEEDGEVGITEAYRTVDASVYQSVADVDDVLDDDDFEEEEEGVPSPRAHGQRDGLHSGQQPTVKSILFNGVVYSFGSLAHGGLLGGLAQFVWSQIRKVEMRQQGSGFQGMQVGHSESVASTLYTQLSVLARSFVTRHSDLAMCHVAAFHKNYHRAAKDVCRIVEDSGKFPYFLLWTLLTTVAIGVEPILHDDISTHICSCVGNAISGIIVIIAGTLLQHQRKRADISDSEDLVNMLAAFLLCYTLLFTVMEPMRASIKAVYVSFAQQPESLSRAFPLIYHRLQRLTTANR